MLFHCLKVLEAVVQLHVYVITLLHPVNGSEKKGELNQKCLKGKEDDVHTDNYMKIILAKFKFGG